MAGCCDTSGYRGAFNTKTAQRAAQSFLDKGLDSTAASMTAALRDRGVSNTSVLEVGAGSGGALVTLFEAGASSAIAFDIAPAYEREARTLMETRGIDASLEWHTGDFVALADSVGVSDVVFLNRVVCCYPDMEALVDAATSKTGRWLAVSYPRNRWLARTFVRLLNGWLRFRRNSFRVFVHDPDAIRRRVEARGLVNVAGGMTPGWHWMVWERTGSDVR
jgi:magnesium-protoporphyrin O-methyltransferase